jgi:hypothetical protein
VIPPLTDTEAVALQSPKQETLVCVGVTVTAVGCTIVVLEVTTHPLASVTVAVMAVGQRLFTPAEPPAATTDVTPVLKATV